MPSFRRSRHAAATASSLSGSPASRVFFVGLAGGRRGRLGIRRVRAQRRVGSARRNRGHGRGRRCGRGDRARGRRACSGSRTSRRSTAGSPTTRVAPAAARQAIADVLAVVPRERETEAAIEMFQRQVQLHHTTGAAGRAPVAHGDEAARSPRRGACAHRGAARLRHHRHQPDGADRCRLLPCLRRAHGARDRRRLWTPADRGHDRSSAAAAGARGRQARRRRHRHHLADAAPRRRRDRAARHQRRRRALCRLSHGAARHHRDGSVPADPVRAGRGSKRRFAGRQCAAAAIGPSHPDFPARSERSSEHRRTRAQPPVPTRIARNFSQPESAKEALHPEPFLRIAALFDGT